MTSKIWRNRTGQGIFQTIVCFILLAGIGYAQSVQSNSGIPGTSEQLADAIAAVKSGEFVPADAEIIAEARIVAAIPDLEKQFTLVSDPLLKAKVAQVLLLLGDRKDVYWDFLAESVKPALESDAPDPYQYDEQGKQIPGLSPEFIGWAKTHGAAPNDAGINAVYVWPSIVKLVGATGDARAIPLLRRALSSPISSLQIAASRGLAEMHDVVSVPTIIERCKNAPPSVANSIAQSLVYFDDPEAQKTLDTYVPKDVAKELRQRRMAGLKR